MWCWDAGKGRKDGELKGERKDTGGVGSRWNPEVVL